MPKKDKTKSSSIIIVKTFFPETLNSIYSHNLDIKHNIFDKYIILSPLEHKA